MLIKLRVEVASFVAMTKKKNMARSLQVIYQSLLDGVAADSTIGGVYTSTSVKAKYRRWCYVVAVATWTLENLFDLFKSDASAIIAAGKPHTALWYANMAKKFQFGYTLVQDEDYYAVIDPTAQIVTYAAAQEQIDYRLRLKVCKTVSGELAPLAGGELSALTTYMGRIKDAGVKMFVTSTAHDDLAFYVTHIFYDPLILNISGERLDGTNDHPVKDAVDAFLYALPYNSFMVLNKLQAVMEAVDGVVMVRLDEVQARITGGVYADVVDLYQADSGWIRRDDAVTNFNYVAHEPVV